MSKLFLFGFLSAMLQGARPPIFTSSKTEEFNYHLTHWPDSRLQFLFSRPESWRLVPIFLSVTCDRWVYTDQQFLLKIKAWIYILCSGTATGTASTPSTALSSVPDHTREQELARSTSAVYLMVWGQTPPLTIDPSFISLEVATLSTASKPNTQVAVTILQLMGETSTEMCGNRRTTI